MMNIDDTNGPEMPKVDVDWAAGGWQPIETAPNGCDDTFMVYKPDWGIEVVEVMRDGRLMHGGVEFLEGATHWMHLPHRPT